MANDLEVKVEEKAEPKDYTPGQRAQEVFNDSIKKIKDENICPFCGREFTKKKA